MLLSINSYVHKRPWKIVANDMITYRCSESWSKSSVPRSFLVQK